MYVIKQALATTASILLAFDTTSPTDIDASTLPKETIVELTSSSDASKSSLVMLMRRVMEGKILRRLNQSRLLLVKFLLRV